MPDVRRLARSLVDRAARIVGPGVRHTVGSWAPLRRFVHWTRSSPTTEPPPSSLPGEPLPPTEVPVHLMGEKPSYRYKLEELKRRHGALGSFELKDPLDAINDKYRAYVFADRHGIDHPRVYGDYDSVHEVNWGDLPEHFVLKTRWGSSNHGVKALVSEGGDTYYDLLRSRSWTMAEIVEHHLALEEKKTASRALFAEELILKPGTRQIADDWKFYCFDGVIGLCMQRDVRATADLSKWRFKFWDPDWNDMGAIHFADRLDPGLEPPADPVSLSRLAEELSTLIARPFVRIDLFETERGPVLGEFTPRPGPPEVFEPEVDEMLGRLWEEAEQRIFAREIRGGVWDHLLVD